jgi:hypothetical protein
MRRWALCLAALSLAAGACSSPNPSGQPTSTPSSVAPSVGSPSPSGSAPRWVALAAAPIVGRISEGVVWTGQEMIVWGGVSGGTQVADGAAFDPAAGSWRVLGPAPSGVLGGGGSAAAWTGHVAVFWAGNSPDGPAAGAVYDPAAGTWRKLPPGPLGVREGYVSVWTGHRLLIMGGAAGDQFASPIAAGVDPATESWKPLRALNRLTGFTPSGAAWDGKVVYLMGRLSLCTELGSSCQRFRPIFVTFAPASDDVRRISLKGIPGGPDHASNWAPAAWTGTEVVFASTSDPRDGFVFYDPATGLWRTGRPAPCSVDTPTYDQMAWAGDWAVLPCGRNRLQLYDPAADAWHVFVAGRSPLNSRFGSAITWTGSRLIVWSGTIRAPGNPTPGSGAMIDLSGMTQG